MKKKSPIPTLVLVSFHKTTKYLRKPILPSIKFIALPDNSIYKFPPLNILIGTFFLLLSFFSHAQTYNWNWAISGGGVQGVDQIYDVKVGSDGLIITLLAAYMVS